MESLDCPNVISGLHVLLRVRMHELSIPPSVSLSRPICELLYEKGLASKLNPVLALWTQALLLEYIISPPLVKERQGP